MLPAHVVLGAIAGVTIFLGLPVARWRAVGERTQGLLGLGAAGVVLFLVIEVGFQAMQRVEAAALGGGDAARAGLILVGGFVLGLVGLAWLEDYRHRKRAAGATPLEVATMVAIGIGVHNFAEGLAIGQSFSGGSADLGMVLVVGFALHNATEGFGIAGPLAGSFISWPRLLALGLIGGGPTAVGSLIGGLWVSPMLELLFLSLATGSLVYVTRELLRIRFAALTATAATGALTAGLLLGFATELVVDIGLSGQVATGGPAAATVRFAGMDVEPSALSLTRGESLEVRNDSDGPLIFEGNGAFPGEVAVSPGASVTVAMTGPPAVYRLVDERGMSRAATITLEPGGSEDPLLVEKNALGALTVLEGHVRAARALHGRGLGGESPHAEDDLRRAGTHAGHPQNELLHGNQPDALALQRLLREHALLETLDRALTAFVERSGDPAVSAEELDLACARVLETVERSREAIGGDAYAEPQFRADVIRFVLETAAGEYATAAEGGRIAVTAAGTPGEDDYIEYQDARAFVGAAGELLAPFRSGLTPEAMQAFDSLERNIFGPLDPVAPDAPIPPPLVLALVRTVFEALPRAG